MIKFKLLLFCKSLRNLFFKYLPFKYLPINNKKIVFSNYLGLGYGCNLKYVAELLHKELPYIEIVWLVNERGRKFILPEYIKKVGINSLKAMYELNTAKIWIDNYHKIDFLRKFLRKRSSQYFIQTWHGSLGIKKIEADVKALVNEKSWKDLAIENAKMQDFLISNSEFEDNVYKSAFWGYGEILRFGHPRNDIFFYDNNDLKENILNSLNINSSCKVVIYVPTFRQGNSSEIYDLDYKILKESLEKKFGGDWVVFVRMHRNIKQKPNLCYKDFVFDVSEFDDVQELLAISDVAITDYSSCIFDFILSRKPAFIYANDIEKYNQERGFYYPLSDTPFAIAKSNFELYSNIINYDEKKYQKNLEIFLQLKGSVDDGKAALRTVKLIKELIKKI